MTFALVHTNGSLVSPSSPLTLTSTTAGNLLVCVLWDGNQGSQPSYTFDTGWVHIPGADALEAGGTACNTQIWYYPNNPGGITSLTVSGGSGNSGFAVYEFSGAGSGGGTVDTSGNAQTNTASTSLAVSTSASAAAHDLAVSVVAVNFVSATKITITPGTGFTQQVQQGNALKQTGHEASDTEVDTGASAAVATDTIAFSVASNPIAASIAAFKATTATATVQEPVIVPSTALMENIANLGQAIATASQW